MLIFIHIERTYIECTINTSVRNQRLCSNLWQPATDNLHTDDQFKMSQGKSTARIKRAQIIEVPEKITKKIQKKLQKENRKKNHKIT